jgi:hypothetical protein
MRETKQKHSWAKEERERAVRRVDLARTPMKSFFLPSSR